RRASDPLVLSRPPSPRALHALSLHDALPIYLTPIRHAGLLRASALAAPHGSHGRLVHRARRHGHPAGSPEPRHDGPGVLYGPARSEEHTSELQSRENLVCRLLLEKKKTTTHQ